MLTINTNVASLNAQRNLSGSQSSLATSLQRLSSGLRINSAKDDAAGLAISERMSSQIRGMDQARRNANDGISLAQTAEGALGQVGDMIQRVRELAVQSANSTNSTSDREALQKEVTQLQSEIERVATTTQFNGLNLLDGSFKSQQFQVGANANQTIAVSVAGARASQIGGFVSQAGTVNAAVSTGFAATTTGATTTAATNANVYNGVSGTASDGSNIQLQVGNGQLAYVADSSGFTGSTSQQGAKSAYALAGAINGSGIAGLTATAKTEQSFAASSGSNFLDFTNATTAGAASYKLSINGQLVIDKSFSASDTTASVTLADAATAINQQSQTTGVTASVDSGKLKLTAADGRDIDLKEVVSLPAGTGTDTTKAEVKTAFSDNIQTVAGTAGTASNVATVRGQVTLNATDSVTFAKGADILNFASSNVPTIIAKSGSMATVDISTVDGANKAILSADAALSSINSSRADLGAAQNRFTASVSTLQTNSENLNASRSRIMDADFASETAMLSRNQVLQQAGTAMLAQANQLPQNVLSLLR